MHKNSINGSMIAKLQPFENLEKSWIFGLFFTIIQSSHNYKNEAENSCTRSLQGSTSLETVDKLVDGFYESLDHFNSL